MDVRPYRAEDREAVRALAGRLLIGMSDWNDPVASAAAVVRWVDGSLDRVGAERPVFVAEHDHEVCGFVTVGRTTHFTGRVEAHVGELAVAGSVTKRGAGRALMTAASNGRGRRASAG